MDRLASLFQHFCLQASVFHKGPLCSDVAFNAKQGVGYVHVLKQGSLVLETQGQKPVEVKAPALLFYLQPTSHRITPSVTHEPKLVCGAIKFDMPQGNPLEASIPRPLIISLLGQDSLNLTLSLLFEEAFSKRHGQQATLDRLCEILVIQLLRYVVDTDVSTAGVLAGLSDPKLVKALEAIHQQPAEAWTLERLAGQAGMSRSRFAAHFRETLGLTPGEYLAYWRLGVAQSLLRQGKSVSWAAAEVGYSSAAALSRAFSARLGRSPLRWLADVMAHE